MFNAVDKNQVTEDILSILKKFQVEDMSVSLEHIAYNLGYSYLDSRIAYILNTHPDVERIQDGEGSICFYRLINKPEKVK